MKMFFLSISVFLLEITTAAAGSPSAQEIQLSVTLLQRVFPGADATRAVFLSFSPEEKSLILNTLGPYYGKDSLFIIGSSKDDTLLGIGIVDQVRGKDQPITYCVVVDPHFHVITIEILVYRELYGGEVRRRSWLDQFIGKSPEDQLRPGREIKNITGATISARSVTLGVRQNLVALRILGPKLMRELQ